MKRKKKSKKRKSSKKPIKKSKEQGPSVEWVPTPFRAPYSGQIVGAIVKALNLRGVSEAGEKLKGNTAVRYFKGERIKDSSRSEVLQHLAQAVLDAQLFDIFKVISIQYKTTTSTKRLSKWFEFLTTEWDRLSSSLRSSSCPINIHVIAPVPYLRLFTLDLALRSAAAFLLKGEKPTKEAPLWSGLENRGTLLKKWAKLSGQTRDQLSEYLEVDENTIDRWLDGQHRPLEENLQWISTRFSELLDKEPEPLLIELRRHYAFNDLLQLLGKYIRKRDLDGLCSAYHRYTKSFYEELEPFINSSLITKYQKEDLPELFFLGTKTPQAIGLVQELWKEETQPTWAKDLQFVCGDWLLRLQEMAQSMRLKPKEIKKMREISRVPDDKLMDYIADILLIKDTQSDVLTPKMIEQSKDYVCIRISGDNKMKAMNRYNQARACEAREDYQQATVHMKRAVELMPEDATYRFLYGAYLGQLCRMEKGQRQETLLRQAIHECEIAVQLPKGTGVEPDKPHVEPGIILYNIGRYQEAKVYLEKEAKKIGMVPWLALKLGSSRYVLRDFKGALECFDVALKKYPDNAIATEKAGHCCFEIGETKKGGEYLKRAHQLGFSELYNFWKRGGFKNANKQKR